MKKIFGLLLIMILAFSSIKADAVILEDNQVKSEIAKQVVKNYKDYTDAQLKVQVVALPFKDLNLPDGQISFLVEPSAGKFLPRDLEKVTIYVDNKPVKTFNAPVVIKAYQKVLVASCPINRERAINFNVVKIEKREVSNNLENALTPDSISKEIIAKKFFRIGEIIDKRFVKLKPDILRNSIVTVFFNTNNLTISTEAKALSDGIIGETICIMNKNYNRIYKGKIIGENKVLVKI